MQLDPEVERRKFAAEVAILERNARQLHANGAIVLRCEQPEIDVLFVPRWPLRAAVLGGILEFPNLSARAFGVRFDLSGYDQRPPSVSFRDPWTWASATHGALPNAILVGQGVQPQLVIIAGHPVTGQSFLCIRGVREYHEHPQHDGDDWAMHRSSVNIFLLTLRIAELAITSVRPVLQPGSVGWGLEPAP
jgi:hypothetical protein